MPTRPHNDPLSIATDSARVADAATADVANPEFKKRISRHELQTFRENIERLKAGDASRTTTLHDQVAAGVHAAVARAAVVAFIRDVRDDAAIVFKHDPVNPETDKKNAVMRRNFGAGSALNAGSTAQVIHIGHELLAASHAHAAEASQVGLDAHGIHHLEDLLQALEGTDLAHVHAANDRHTNTTALDSLAHLVSAEAAHIRLAARRVFRGDEAKLNAYKRTLPRHAVTPRTATTPAAAAAPAT